MRRRLREAARECDAGLGYDYIIINDDLDETVESLAQVCLGARHRRVAN
jgi:guanylate kinase